MEESRAKLFAYANKKTRQQQHQKQQHYCQENRINSSTLAHKLKRNESILPTVKQTYN